MGLFDGRLGRLLPSGRRLDTISSAANTSEPPSPPAAGTEKTGNYENNAVTAEEAVFNQPLLQAGELSLEEASEGGMGRHLGLFSTTFLM